MVPAVIGGGGTVSLYSGLGRGVRSYCTHTGWYGQWPYGSCGKLLSWSDPGLGVGRGTVSLYSGLGVGYSLTVLTLADMASDPMAPVVSFYLDQIQDWGWGSSLTVQRIGGWGYSLTVLRIGMEVQFYCTHTGWYGQWPYGSCGKLLSWSDPGLGVGRGTVSLYSGLGRGVQSYCTHTGWYGQWLYGSRGKLLSWSNPGLGVGVQSHCTQDLGWGYSLSVLTLADMASDSMVPAVIGGGGTVSLYSGLGVGYSLTVLTQADMASDPMTPVVSFYLGQIQDWGWGYSITVLRIGDGDTVSLYSGLGVGVQSYCTHTGWYGQWPYGSHGKLHGNPSKHFVPWHFNIKTVVQN